MPPSAPVQSALITLLAYAVLPGYDAAALRYVGSRLPLPRVAFGSFIAYAFSQTLGFPLLTGGSVRYGLADTPRPGGRTAAAGGFTAGHTRCDAMDQAGDRAW